jgi:hypothetical protein
LLARLTICDTNSPDYQSDTKDAGGNNAGPADLTGAFFTLIGRVLFTW